MDKPNSRTTLRELLEAGLVEATVGFPFGGHNDAKEGVPHIRPFNVRPDGEISLDQIKSIPTSAALGKPRLAKNDIVFNNTNTKELVGKCALWMSDGECVFSNHMTRLRVADDSLVPDYLSFSICHHWLTGKSAMLARAHVAQASIMGERLGEIEILKRTTDEQRQISILLNHVLHVRRSQEGQIENAYGLKRSVMVELFERGLRGETQVETEFGLIPSNWNIATLDDCAVVQTGVAKGRKFADAAAVDVPYLRVANVQDGHLDLNEVKTIKIRRSEVERYRLKPGDVVLTEGGDFDKLGRGFIWRGELDLCVHQNHVFAVRPYPDRLTPEFLAYLAQSAYGKGYFLKVAHKTTNLASINSTKLKAFPVVTPALEEQREIVAILDAIDRKIDLHKRKRTVVDDLFRTLLHELMTGEVRVDQLDLSVLPSYAQVST